MFSWEFLITNFTVSVRSEFEFCVLSVSVLYNDLEPTAIGDESTKDSL